MGVITSTSVVFLKLIAGSSDSLLALVRTIMTEIFAGCESAWNDCVPMPMIWCACELDYGTDPQKSHILFCLRIDFLFVCVVFVFF